MLTVRFSVSAMRLLAGLLLAPPAVAGQAFAQDPPPTKWFPGEKKNVPTTPGVLSMDESPTTLPGLFLDPSKFALNAPSGSTATLPAVARGPAPVVTVRSWIDPDEDRFHLGDEIDFYVELRWVGDHSDVELDRPEEPLLTNLEKKSMLIKDWVEPGEIQRTVVRTYRYLLAPTEEGAAAIEPIEVPYRIRGESELVRLTTDRFALEILARRWPWGKIVLGALGLIAVAGGGGVAVAGFAARRRRAREAALVPDSPSPFAAMKDQLGQIRRSFADGAARDGYDAVERLVRKSLGERLGADFRTVTIDELSNRLANESLDTAIRDRAGSILDRCGQVKFAGYAPTVADQEQLVADCRLLLDDLEEEHGRRIKDEGPRAEDEGLQ